MEDILAACAEWATMRELEAALGVPTGHRAHQHLRTRLGQLVSQGRAETRRLDGQDRQWKAVPGYRPRQTPLPDAEHIIGCVEDGDSTAEIARKLGITQKAAYGRLYRLKAKGELMADSPGRFVQDRWYKPFPQTD